MTWIYKSILNSQCLILNVLKYHKIWKVQLDLTLDTFIWKFDIQTQLFGHQGNKNQLAFQAIRWCDVLTVCWGQRISSAVQQRWRHNTRERNKGCMKLEPFETFQQYEKLRDDSQAKPAPLKNLHLGHNLMRWKRHNIYQTYRHKYPQYYDFQ